MIPIDEKHAKACRKYARQIWLEQPDLSPKDMIQRIEIKDIACEGIQYLQSQYLEGIRPFDTPDDELLDLVNLSLWKLYQAVAVWLDINPFIVFQARKSGNVEMWNLAFHPNLRSSFSKLIQQAENSAHEDKLKVMKDSQGEMLVTPEEFYRWGMTVTTWPNGDRPTNFFEKLKVTPVE